MRNLFIFCLSCFLVFATYAQNGTIRGKVYSAQNHEPLSFATVQIQGTSLATSTDIDGKFSISAAPGFVRLIVRMVGYQTTTSPEIHVQGNQTTHINIEVAEASVMMQEVIARPNLRTKKIESPISTLSIGVAQIEKSAGANRDVSKVLQTLPGVGSTSPDRNDLIVRGGGPSENVFYLDEIEIPIINHFTTQGASGGVVGIINPDFVREVSFYTGAFPANRINALSSVMEVRQKDGSSDRLHTKIAVGASDAALTLDGPLSPKSTFIASARQSYLTPLFKLIGLPFLPTYNDFQLKYKYEIDKRNSLSITAIGSLDKMNLNTDLQKNGDEGQKYLLSYLPQLRQWNYAIGAVYKHFTDAYYDTWVLSRNMLRNKNYKHPDNDTERARIFDLYSDETENKLRYERVYARLPFKLQFGAGIQYAAYLNETKRSYFENGTVKTGDYNTKLNLFSYHFALQLSDEYFDDRLKVSFGVNMMGNNFNNNMKNPLNQLSPRLSISYALSDKWDINANTGRYMMRPSYTMLGYKSPNGLLANKNERLKHIVSDQAILGIEFRPREGSHINIEGFYKQYDQYPLSVADGISTASKGVGYDPVGNEEVYSEGKGRSYGIELTYKTTAYKGFNLTTTYTFFRSEFTNVSGDYLPSSWDTRHILNLLGSYTLGKSWTFSARWRFVGGAPYSPIDEGLSTNKEAWALTNQPYTDYSRFNSLRLSPSHQLDMRIDKEFYFNKWLLNLYIDIQNVYNARSSREPIYTNKDKDGNVMEDPADPTRQRLRVLDIYNGTILPTLGIIIRL